MHFKKRTNVFNLIIYILIFISIIYITSLLTGCTNSNNHKLDNNTNTTLSTKKVNSTNIKIAAVGDVMVHQPQLNAQYNAIDNSYSFDNNFNFVKKYIISADLALANLETTLRGAPYTSYPQFSSPDEILTALKNSGFDVISTINNHSSDTGKQGITRTLDVIKEHNLESIGTRKNSEDKNYVIKDINGIKIGMAGFSYGDISGNNKYLNGIKIPSELTDCVNVINSTNPTEAFDIIQPVISDIKSESVDLTILFIHWGEEYKREPNSYQKELAQMLCNEGIDIILGSHPHVVQPIDILYNNDESNKENKTFVVYSMGNFLSNQRKEILNKPYTEDGIIPLFEVEKDFDLNKTIVKKVEYIPTWVNKYFDSSKNKYTYEIIPYIESDPFLSTLENSTLEKLKESYNNTTSIMPKSTDIQPMTLNSNLLSITKN